jgi:ATP-dependent Clp protease ATP-binding subunit ClpB
LPDKAIDLIDEAASRIRMEIDSKPESMDRLERRLIQLKIEREAVKKDESASATKELAQLNEQIGQIEREYADLEDIWLAEKAAVQGLAQIKSDIEQAKLELEVARRASDLTRMSEIQHGVLPDLERRLAAAAQGEQPEPTLLRSRVTDEEVAEVVSRWTGIPVAKMLEGDREKLLRMEDTLHHRVVGQHEAVAAVSNAVRRARAGLADPNRPNGSFLFLGPTGVVRLSCAKRSLIIYSTASKLWFGLICRSSWRGIRSPG